MTTTEFAPKKVSILDLTMEQTEAIEEAVGVPVAQWKSPPSQSKLFRHIVAAGNGLSPDDQRLKKMTLGAFLDLVSLDDTASDPTSTDGQKA